MNPFRTVVLAAALLTASSALAFPPERDHHEPPAPEIAAAKMAQHLDLDDATRSTVQAILADAQRQGAELRAELEALHAELKAERSSDEPNRKRTEKLFHQIADVRVAVQMLRLDAHEEIQGLLTPEQAAKAKQHQARRGERREQRPRHDDAPGSGEDLLEGL